VVDPPQTRGNKRDERARKMLVSIAWSVQNRLAGW